MNLLFGGSAGHAMLWKEKERRDAEEEAAAQQVSTPKKASSSASATSKKMPAAAPTAMTPAKASWTPEDAGLAIMPWRPCAEKVKDDEKDEHPGFICTGLGLLEPEIVCHRCGNEVNPLKATKKGPHRFLCGSCNYKGVKLHRLFGHWQIREFKGLDPETEKEFWKVSGTNN